MAGRADALLRLLFALVLLANGIATFVQGAQAAGARWSAAEVEQLVSAGLLCEHEQAGPSDHERSPAQPPCCGDCIACPFVDGLMGPVPTPVSVLKAGAFRTAAPDLPAFQLSAQLPFKRGPPPRAPPHLVISAPTA